MLPLHKLGTIMLLGSTSLLEQGKQIQCMLGCRPLLSCRPLRGGSPLLINRHHCRIRHNMHVCLILIVLSCRHNGWLLLLSGIRLGGGMQLGLLGSTNSLLIMGLMLRGCMHLCRLVHSRHLCLILMVLMVQLFRLRSHMLLRGTMNL